MLCQVDEEVMQVTDLYEFSLNLSRDILSDILKVKDMEIFQKISPSVSCSRKQVTSETTGQSIDLLKENPKLTYIKETEDTKYFEEIIVKREKKEAVGSLRRQEMTRPRSISLQETPGKFIQKKEEVQGENLRKGGFIQKGEKGGNILGLIWIILVLSGGTFLAQKSWGENKIHPQSKAAMERAAYMKESLEGRSLSSRNLEGSRSLEDTINKHQKKPEVKPAVKPRVKTSFFKTHSNPKRENIGGANKTEIQRERNWRQINGSAKKVRSSNVSALSFASCRTCGVVPSDDSPINTLEQDLKAFEGNGPGLKMKEDLLKVQSLDQKGHALLKKIIAKDSSELGAQLKRYAAASKKRQVDDGKRKTGGLYMFISLSLHKNTLRSLLESAKRYGGTLVLRGLKDNSWKETLALMLPIMKEYGEGIILDPILFKRFKVKKVPTILVTEEERDFLSQDPKALEGEAASNVFDKVAGNLSVKYALEMFSRKGDLKAAAQGILGRSDA